MSSIVGHDNWVENEESLRSFFLESSWIIDSVGNKTTYAYDVNDRRIGETNATAKTIVYQYDLAGNQAYPFRDVPQGLTKGQFGDAADIIRASKAGQYSDDIVVQGSRTNGTARPNSDIDFGVRVPEDKFNQILNDRFGTPNPGSAKERTLQNAIETGKIQSGEAGLRPLRKQLESQLGIDVDISVIKQGGAFDQRPIY
jgi:YD repeat-containing protein